MLLFDVVYAHRASGSHHKIAMDALLRLSGRDAEMWQKLFLANADVYMKGAKAPDDVFRDSQNHVLHVRDNYWGGAVEAAEAWYEKLLMMIRARNWPEAVYAAGVLSHYVCDPMQPLHTAQCESEGSIHRAFEQSVSKSYSKLMAQIDARGWPDIPAQAQPGWLRTLIRSGAEASVIHYDACIDHYNLAAGVKDPPAGLDTHLIDAMADALARAIVSFAHVLDKAFVEAAVAPPKTAITLQGCLATLDIPIQWVLRKMEDAAERAVVAEMYGEYQSTGKVVTTLAHDDRIVRAAHAREVLQRPLGDLDLEPARAPGTMHGYRDITPASAAAVPVVATPAIAKSKKPAPVVAAPVVAAPVVAARVDETPAPVKPAEVVRPDAVVAAVVAHAPAPDPAPDPAPIEVATSTPGSRKVRTRASPVVDAPAIGQKIAARLEAIGIRTIGDLLDADPQAVTAMLAQKWLTPDTVTDWKAMAQLAIDVAAVGEQDAQILIGCGVRDRAQLAGHDARALQDQLEDFIASEDGRRLMRGATGPKPAKVEAWIEAARSAA